MSKPILSICIPTYRREEFLKLLLESIVEQDGFWSEVEIMIYNDPYEDNTQAMVESFQHKYSNIRYHRNEQRIWMIPSILESVNMCSGEYVWFYSDDDIMSPIAIQTMLEVIKKEKSDLILNKFLSFPAGAQINTQDINYTWGITSVQWMDNYFKFLSDVSYSIDGYMMHCSLFCFKKALFIDNLNSLLKEKGSEYMEILKKDYFAHVKIIYIPFWKLISKWRFCIIILCLLTLS